MTETEKYNERLAALDEAITAVYHAATVDRKLSTDRHHNGHYTKALHELNAVREAMVAKQTRFEATGN